MEELEEEEFSLLDLSTNDFHNTFSSLDLASPGGQPSHLGEGGAGGGRDASESTFTVLRSEKGNDE